MFMWPFWPLPLLVASMIAKALRSKRRGERRSENKALFTQGHPTPQEEPDDPELDLELLVLYWGPKGKQKHKELTFCFQGPM